MSCILRGNDNPPDEDKHGWEIALVLPLTGLIMWLVFRVEACIR